MYNAITSTFLHTFEHGMHCSTNDDIGVTLSKNVYDHNFDKEHPSLMYREQWNATRVFARWVKYYEIINSYPSQNILEINLHYKMKQCIFVSITVFSTIRQSILHTNIMCVLSALMKIPLWRNRLTFWYLKSEVYKSRYKPCILRFVK